VTALTSTPRLHERTIDAAPAIVTIIAARKPQGVMATTGGWAYCQQLRALAERTHHTLVCGKYVKDAYTGRGLRKLRHLDWGNPTYLARLASTIRTVHGEVGRTARARRRLLFRLRDRRSCVTPS
jgi:hypothetical protein